MIGVFELEFINVDFFEFFLLGVEVGFLMIFGFKFLVDWVVMNGCFVWIGEMFFLLGCLNVINKVGKFYCILVIEVILNRVW